MVGHVSLEEQVDADFSHARRKATLRRAGPRLRSDNASDGLPCLAFWSPTRGPQSAPWRLPCTRGPGS